MWAGIFFLSEEVLGYWRVNFLNNSMFLGRTLGIVVCTKDALIL